MQFIFLISYDFLIQVVVSLQLVNSMVTLLISWFLCFVLLFFLFVAFGCNQSIQNALPLVTYTTLPTCQ